SDGMHRRRAGHRDDRGESAEIVFLKSGSIFRSPEPAVCAGEDPYDNQDLEARQVGLKSLIAIWISRYARDFTQKTSAVPCVLCGEIGTICKSRKWASSVVA